MSAEKRQAQHRRQMRSQGFEDGSSGRAARWTDADYQASWRRGREVMDARQQLEGKTLTNATG